jgi:hypothetical protein
MADPESPTLVEYLNGDTEEVSGAPAEVEAKLVAARREDAFCLLETRKGDEIRINPQTVRALKAEQSRRMGSL